MKITHFQALIFLFFIIFQSIFFIKNSLASLCKKSDIISIEMDENWKQIEEARLANENELLSKYSEYISKRTKPLSREKYNCIKGVNCDPLKNCQMHYEPEKFHEVEYLIAIDTGIILAKSYCSEIGKCIGYNDFIHSLKVTASEDRLIDIKKDNAIFYHYFYSTNPQNYESPFVMINFHTGSELHLKGKPNFSPDETKMIEIYSIDEKQESETKKKFFINIYEMNKYGEFVKVKNASVKEEDSKKEIVNTEERSEQIAEVSKIVDEDFLSQNLSCGTTPHFHSWKNNYEARISMLSPYQANEGKKVILAYNRKEKKWECQDDAFPKFECKSYLPSSLKFVSNLNEDQINECKEESKTNILETKEIAAMPSPETISNQE